MIEDSEPSGESSLGTSSTSGSPSLLSNLRQFRFQKKPLPKIDNKITSDSLSLQQSPCNYSLQSPELSPQPRRKVCRLQLSDDEEGPITNMDSEEAEAQVTEANLQFLQDAFPDKDKMELQDVLASNGWDTQVAASFLCNSLTKSNTHKNLPPVKDNTVKYDKKFKRRRILSGGSSDGDGLYHDHPVFDSSDSEAEVDEVHMTRSQRDVLEFLSTASEGELRAMPNCSLKKAQALLELRPFNSWRHLVKKVKSSRGVNCDVLNAAQEVLQSRAVVKQLMKRCVQLATQMERAVVDGATNLTKQPSILAPQLQLANYQLVGLNWLVAMHGQGLNGILADEMGLGKTVQVISFLAHLKEANGEGEHGPHLIVVPSSTLDNWNIELVRWCPSLRIAVYYGSQVERRAMRVLWHRGGLHDIDVILTTYNLVSSCPEERKMFRVMQMDYVVLDEAHMLKNMATQRYDNLMRINAKHRILLTGTPLQNNLLELMSLLIFVMPHMFAGKKDYLKSLFVSKVVGPTGDRKGSQEAPRFEQAQVAQARRIMKPFVLRRLKRDVLRDLPGKRDETVPCTMTPDQGSKYHDLVRHFTADTAITAEVSEGELPPSGLTMMMQLRKLANHPALLQYHYTPADLRQIAKYLSTDMLYKPTDEEHILDDLTYMSDFEIHQLTLNYKSIVKFRLPESVILESGKFEVLDSLLPRLKREGHRVLIFSQFVMMLDVLEEYLTIRRHSFLRLDGSTPVGVRQQLIDDFNSDPDLFAFLLSTRAGGLGINLTSADTVLLHDIDFNPYNDKQAEDRCHRMGQKREVSVYRMITSDSIEEGIFQVAQEKLHLEREINSSEDGESAEAKNVVRLLKLAFGLEAKAPTPVKAS